MKNELAALRETIVAETVSIYPDFHFFLGPDKDGNLTAECRGTWEANRIPDPHDVPFLTIEHEGDRFLVSHYRWSDRKKYKTLKGAAKYVNGELQSSCNRKREHKAKADAEREHEKRSIEILRELHAQFNCRGIASKLCLVADRYNTNHLSVEANRINASIDITVTHDYRLEATFSYRSFYTTPETALDIFSIMSKKETA